MLTSDSCSSSHHHVSPLAVRRFPLNCIARPSEVPFLMSVLPSSPRLPLVPSFSTTSTACLHLSDAWCAPFTGAFAALFPISLLSPPEPHVALFFFLYPFRFRLDPLPFFFFYPSSWAADLSLSNLTSVQNFLGNFL